MVVLISLVKLIQQILTLQQMLLETFMVEETKQKLEKATFKLHQEQLEISTVVVT